MGIFPPILIHTNYYRYYPAISQGKITVHKYFNKFLPTTYPFTIPGSRVGNVNVLPKDISTVVGLKLAIVRCTAK